MDPGRPEYAARGGPKSKIFCWGDEFARRGKMMANTWQGEFPWQNQMLDGYERTSPVKHFRPNGYGLFDKESTFCPVMPRLLVGLLVLAADVVGTPTAWLLARFHTSGMTRSAARLLRLAAMTHLLVLAACRAGSRSGSAPRPTTGSNR